MKKVELELRLASLEAQNARLMAQMKIGRFKFAGKYYGGVQLEPELYDSAMGACRELLPEQLDTNEEGSGLLFLIWDREETVAGIERYIVRYSYNNREGTHVESIYRAVELPL